MKGSLEVICGPMYSGKSEELIRRIRRFEIARQKAIVFKPKIDNRYEQTDVVSHSGLKTKAFPVSSGKSILKIIDDVEQEFDVVAIDEVQFFDESIVNTIVTLVDRGVKVLVSGLDQDFREQPFGQMGELLARADKVLKLTAICHSCGGEATTTQRLVEGQPAPYSGETILVGARDSYEARCRDCHKEG